MPSGPGYLPVAFAVLLLTSGVFFAPLLEHGLPEHGPVAAAGPVLEAPIFRIEYRPGFLDLAGTVGSAGHESALLQAIEDQFDADSTRVDFRPGVVLPADWETASVRLLYALAATESGVAVMEGDRITIRGVTADGDTLASRLRFLQESISQDVEMDEDVIVVEASASVVELCREVLVNALREPVEFRQSSAELRTSSYATLDKIIDVANDCRRNRIAITGHTDASGDEAWNRHLSLARARAVADYIIRGGIAPARLIVAGAGSSEPIADNTTASGRSRNRRIEFELR